MKQIRLVNFGGFEDSTFKFTQTDLGFDGYVPPSLRPIESVVPISLFYGPNGIGKSTILEAIRFVANPKVFYGRSQSADIYLRPWIRDNNFIPLSDHVLAKNKQSMKVDAIFTDGIKDYNIVLTNLGFEKNELPERPEGASSGGHMFYVDADNPINWSKFQLISTDAQRFIDLAEAIYGYPCDLDGDVQDHHYDDEGNVLETQTYYQDLVITKGNATVHFARMSAGEKKIATMVRMLCNPDNVGDRDIILIDNWEMHVYFKRHPRMIEKLKEYFSGKQIIATTHSQSMIEYGAKASYVKNFDLEEYKPEYKMLEEIQSETTVSVDAVTVAEVEKVAPVVSVSIPESPEVAPVAQPEPEKVVEETPPPVGFVRKSINTPFGVMNVLVPANSDKLKLNEDGSDPLQNMVNNAVAIDIDESGNVAGYHDPAEEMRNKFRPGSGQIVRGPTRLTPGQRRRQELGEQIVTGPVTAERTAGTFEDLAVKRVDAIRNGISSPPKTIRKIVRNVSDVESTDSVIASVEELGRGGCQTSFCGTLAPAPVTEEVVIPAANVPQLNSEWTSVPDKVERPVEVAVAPTVETTIIVDAPSSPVVPPAPTVEPVSECKPSGCCQPTTAPAPAPKGFWSKVLDFITGE